ncbi:MAG: hypothetical protein SAJ37_03155 [Oscillatoria sp. PMC 1068.18]|nr:hypothetical protein [Oscillatoria sp. PMC 1076.18]MEC4987723.1 hypothetical protein [Oscillatoria sp. PMC 1068.18]
MSLPESILDSTVKTLSWATDIGEPYSLHGEYSIKYDRITIYVESNKIDSFAKQFENLVPDLLKHKLELGTSINDFLYDPSSRFYSLISTLDPNWWKGLEEKQNNIRYLQKQFEDSGSEAILKQIQEEQNSLSLHDEVAPPPFFDYRKVFYTLADKGLVHILDRDKRFSGTLRLHFSDLNIIESLISDVGDKLEEFLRTNGRMSSE